MSKITKHELHNSLKTEIDKIGILTDDVNEHKGDNVSHVTNTERNTWNNKANASHTHQISNVDGLQTALNNKQDALPVENRRKITFGTADPTGGSNGDIYFQYE